MRGHKALQVPRPSQDPHPEDANLPFGKTQAGIVPSLHKQVRHSYIPYERADPGSLIYGDLYRLLETHPHHILFMDDASRVILAGVEFSEEIVEAAITTLEAACQRAETWGVEIQEVNADRGHQFFANAGETPSSAHAQFGQYLAVWVIRHVLSRVNHPRTKGSWSVSGSSRIAVGAAFLCTRSISRGTTTRSTRQLGRRGSGRCRSRPSSASSSDG